MIFTYIKFLLRFFLVISSPECGVVLFVVLCGVVWFRVLLRCSLDSYWKISISQSQIQSMIWTSTLQIQKHEYSDDLDFIILFFVCILLYAINLHLVSMLVDSSFMSLIMLIMLLYLMYSIYLNEWISFFFLKRKIRSIPILNFFSLIPSDSKHRNINNVYFIPILYLFFMPRFQP